MTSSKLLDMQGVADRTGLTYKTVRNYHHIAEARRAAGESRPGDMPPPAATFGRSPVWEPKAIDKWISNRPGRGVGGGRPRKDVTAHDKGSTRSRRRD